MLKRIVNIFICCIFAFFLYYNCDYIENSDIKRHDILFNVKSENEISNENINFEDNTRGIKSKINYNYLFIDEEKVLYSNIDKTPIYFSPEINNDEVAFYINKRDSIKSIGYNKFNDIYRIVGLDNKCYYIKNENLSFDKNLIFDEIDGIRYIKEEAAIKDYPSKNSTNIIQLNINDTIELIADNKLGYYKVRYDKTEGYISKENLSETKINYVTNIQQKIADIAKNNQGTYPCTANYCAAWVEGVYHAAGLNYLPCFGNAIDYWNKWKDSGSSSLEKIPIGAVVVGSGSGSYMGNLYGHVGIYLGNGLVAENIGKHNITDINSWIASQKGICQGYHGFIGWVWPYGQPLGEGY